MKKIVIGLAIGLASFVIGIAGLYYAMPKLAPDRVAETQEYLDSVRLATDPALDSLYQARFGDVLAAADSVRVDTSAMTDMRQSLTAVKDSLRRARDEFERLMKENEALKNQQKELDQRLDKLETQNVTAANFSTNLAKLEDDELGAILGQLDLGTLRMLYVQASTRDRARLLQAMAPDRAATFVRTVLGVAPPPPASEAPANTPIAEPVPGSANR